MRIEGRAPGGRSNLERGSRTERNHGALPPRNSVGYGVCRSECRSRRFGAAPQALASACRRGRRLRSQRRESAMSTLRASATMKVFLLAPFWPFNPLAIPALRIFGVFGGRFRWNPAGDFDAPSCEGMLGARLDASACFAAGIAGAWSRCSTMACATSCATSATTPHQPCRSDEVHLVRQHARRRGSLGRGAACDLRRWRSTPRSRRLLITSGRVWNAFGTPSSRWNR
jgi:hypothetical protein